MNPHPSDHKNDAYYIKAKKSGYRARSAYKLLEIQKKFNIFKRAFYILDLGSAPGSWLQVSKEIATENLVKYDDSHYHRDHFKIMGVDIKKLTPIGDIKIIRMNLKDMRLKNKIFEYFKGEKLDLIISDASIKKSGIKFSDQAKQIKLCYQILNLLNTLKRHGNFIIKAFQGEDFEYFYNDLKKNFIMVKTYKPKSSYKKSNEIYIIALKKK